MIRMTTLGLAALVLLFAQTAGPTAQNTSSVYQTVKRPRALALIGDRYHSPTYIRDGLVLAFVRENIPVTFIENVAALNGMNLTEADFGRRGLHPEIGEVTLRQLLTTWVVHDLDHVAQVARTMAKVYTEATGPWSAYLSILRDRQR